MYNIDKNHTLKLDKIEKNEICVDYRTVSWYSKMCKWIGRQTTLTRREKMRHFILVTHADMAKGIAASAEFIVGKQENLTCYCAYTEEADFKKKICDQIDALGKDEEIILMTDMLGGSVNSELMELTGRKNVHLATGINLAFLIGILTGDSAEPAETLIEETIVNAKENMVYCNRINVSGETLDDF